jgi:Polyketide cyclase / dehydrase and lipid transport
MPVITVEVDTPVSAERITSALTDFSADRPALFPNLAREHYQVHGTGETWAEVTEGASFLGGIWERERYEWNEPGIVRAHMIDSNTFAPGSSWTYTITPRRDGGAHVRLVVDRRPGTARGRVLAVLLLLFGRRVLRSDLLATLDRLRD